MRGVLQCIMRQVGYLHSVCLLTSLLDTRHFPSLFKKKDFHQPCQLFPYQLLVALIVMFITFIKLERAVARLDYYYFTLTALAVSLRAGMADSKCDCEQQHCFIFCHFHSLYINVNIIVLILNNIDSIFITCAVL